MGVEVGVAEGCEELMEMNDCNTYMSLHFQGREGGWKEETRKRRKRCICFKTKSKPM